MSEDSTQITLRTVLEAINAVSVELHQFREYADARFNQIDAEFKSVRSEISDLREEMNDKFSDLSGKISVLNNDVLSLRATSQRQLRRRQLVERTKERT